MTLHFAIDLHEAVTEESRVMGDLTRTALFVLAR
jgi:hypothetical protein